MRFQKGQSVVEFALILPFFIFFLFGIIYFGMGFADYVALNDIARGSARAASISTDKAPYESIKDEYKKQPLPANLYEVKEFQIDDLKSKISLPCGYGFEVPDSYFPDFRVRDSVCFF